MIGKWLQKQLYRFRQHYHHPENKELSTMPQSSTVPPPRHFELLPDEILLEIFEYIHYLQLYHDFVNLNARINAILRSVPIVVDASLFFGNNVDVHFTDAIRYFAPQVIKITIGRCPSLDLTRFSNLRSLDFYAPTRAQLASISPCFMSKLIHIRLGSLQQQDQSILHNIIFASPTTQQFSSLRRCDFVQLSLTHLNIVPQTCSTIRTLSISQCTPDEFFRFLSLLPNLNRLRMRISGKPSLIIDNTVVIHHDKLIDLYIGFVYCHDQLSLLDWLLSCVPNIHRCKLSLFWLDTIKDFVRLDRILVERLIHLRKLYCTVDYLHQEIDLTMVPRYIFEDVRINLFLFENMTKVRCIEFCSPTFSITIVM